MLDDNASGKKLLGGLFRLVSVILFYIYLGPDWVKEVQHSIVSTLSSDPKSAGANLVADLFRFAISIWMIYWFVLGIYKIYTFNMYVDEFECKLTPFQKKYMKDVDPSTSNIEEAMRYRNAKMRTMTPERAAEYYLDTNRVLGSATNKSVVGYINSKMTFMSPEQRISFLRGKK
jgi:hypothetical protein